MAKIKYDRLPPELREHYRKLKPAIKKRLKEFKQVKPEDYFYEFCFCICTPQSKAKNAWEIQKILMKKDFLNKQFDPTEYLRNPIHYIRFHNQKGLRLLRAREYFPEITDILNSKSSNIEKRNAIREKAEGFGFKESSHFMRNIGYQGLAILDRHILKHLVYCNVFKEVPKIGSKKQYIEIEQKFLDFSAEIGIPIDELDILFWSYESGEILK